ncbi:MAG: galactose-1-phosphate uridylyltransferase [Planctomycetes bacterium]|nr:galactose-1-phosphate uridylyltransferase [Planctomycetota bacterium]
MSEYRYNLITNRWVILSAQRGHRPSDYSRRQSPSISDYDENCPFCPGQEKMTPPEIASLRPTSTEPDSPGWTVRVVPNKYPALHEKIELFNCDPSIARPALGRHEVIIESPRHNCSFEQHDFEQARQICYTLRERYLNHHRNRRPRLISIFYNHGRTSGASLSHPHFQLMAQDVIPSRLIDQLNHCRNYLHQHQQNVFDVVIQNELTDKSRLVAENNFFAAFCPYASMVSYELYLVPKIDQSHLGMITDEMLDDFTQLLQHILRRLKHNLNDPDYNLVFHTAPSDEKDYPGFRWYVQLYPRLNVPGGFELATDTYINTLPPESAAQSYRDE